MLKSVGRCDCGAIKGNRDGPTGGREPLGGGSGNQCLRIVQIDSLVGNPVHLSPGQAVFPDHVPAHCADHGERLLAEGTRRLPRVFLHVLGEVPPVNVGGAADGTHTRAAT